MRKMKRTRSPFAPSACLEKLRRTSLNDHTRPIASTCLERLRRTSESRPRRLPTWLTQLLGDRASKRVWASAFHPRHLPT